MVGTISPKEAKEAISVARELVAEITSRVSPRKQ